MTKEEAREILAAIGGQEYSPEIIRPYDWRDAYPVIDCGVIDGIIYTPDGDYIDYTGEEYGRVRYTVHPDGNYAVLDREYGTVTYDGQVYVLQGQAYLSDRVFPGGWHDAEEGEEYTTEYYADAVDPDGNDYIVVWQFDTVKGEEPEDEENYDWSDDNIVEVRRV